MYSRGKEIQLLYYNVFVQYNNSQMLNLIFSHIYSQIFHSGENVTAVKQHYWKGSQVRGEMDKIIGKQRKGYDDDDFSLNIHLPFLLYLQICPLGQWKANVDFQRS